MQAGAIGLGKESRTRRLAKTGGTTGEDIEEDGGEGRAEGGHAQKICGFMATKRWHVKMPICPDDEAPSAQVKLDYSSWGACRLSAPANGGRAAAQIAVPPMG